MTRTRIGLLILRLALAVVFFWFGFSQLLNGLDWVGLVPAWAVTMLHLPPAMIVLGNGALEVVLGIFLAAGILTRTVAFFLAAHLGIIAFSLGLSSNGIRDFGLTAATLALVFTGKGRDY